jgi:hypothetical protein
MSREEHKDAIEVSIIFHEGQRMFAVPKQPAPVQEPVGDIGWGGSVNWHKAIPEFGADLYTTPPSAQRPWVGLTQDEFRDFASTLDYGTGGLIRAIEAKLKEKNNG